MQGNPPRVASQATERRLSFLDLPQEVQKDIVAQVCVRPLYDVIIYVNEASCLTNRLLNLKVLSERPHLLIARLETLSRVGGCATLPELPHRLSGRG